MKREIIEKIDALRDLPSFPAILKGLIEVFENEKSSFVDVADVVRYDQSLTERILRIANSPFFGHSGRVNNLEQAIMLMGYDLVKGVCLSVSVFRFLHSGERQRVERLWQHSFEVAVIAANIADHVGNVDRSVSFVSGLLHDIGRVLFLTIDGERYTEMMAGVDIVEAEVRAYGGDHGMAGGRFLEDALIPEEIVCTVRYHHKPSMCDCYNQSFYGEVASVVALAEAFSRSFFPKIEDDGVWTSEHDAIVLEFHLDEQRIAEIRERSAEEAAEAESLLGV